MNPKATKFVVGLGISTHLFVFSTSLPAQISGSTLSGTVTDPSGAVVRDAQISVKTMTMHITAATAVSVGQELCVTKLQGPAVPIEVSDAK